MKFIHAFASESYWRGLEKKGFLNRQSGVKIHQMGATPDLFKFNIIADKNTRLSELIKNFGVFYIDRIAGGIPYYHYNPNRELLEYYSQMLGDNFWGFQFHEWASNFLLDVQRLQNVKNWDLQSINEYLKKNYIYKGQHPLHMYSVEQYYEMGFPPADSKSFLSAMTSLYLDKTFSVNNRLFPCDSYLLTCDFAAKNGAGRLMPEVGDQIGDMRIQIAYARGISKVYQIPFGVYYEPWSHYANSICYNRDGENEWHVDITKTDFPIIPHGGSSRELQKRIFFYSYISGAEFISEEWGAANTFFDWKDYELSPYGKIKHDFIKFTECYGEFPKPYTPFAVILPESMKVIDMAFLYGQDTYLGFDFESHLQEKTFKTARTALRRIFGKKSNNRYGEESKNGTLLNGGFFDMFDIIHADNVSAFQNYKYLIDLTETQCFKQHPNCISLDTAEILCNQLAPVNIDGTAHVIFNKFEDFWILTLFNHDGVDHSPETPEKLICDAAIHVKVTLKSPCQKITLIEGIAPHQENDCWYFDLPASSMSIVKIV